MGVEAKQDALCSIKKTLRSAVRTTCRCASENWALFSLLLLPYLLYKYSPGFFAFLLSNSPVIICTALLLGVLLNYGGAHRPEIREDVNIKGDQRFSVPAMKEDIIREASVGRRDSNKCIDLDENAPLLKGHDQRDERVEAAGGRPVKVLTSYAEKESNNACLSKDNGNEYANLSEDVHRSRVDGKEAALGVYSSSENVREDAEMVASPNYEGRVCTDSQSGEVVDVSEHRTADGAAGKCRWGRAFSVRRRKKLADIKIEAINSVVDNQLDHSLCSPLTGVGSHDVSPGFDPDNAHHSPGVSMTDTGAVLDETEPLFGADCSRPHRITNDESDNHSIVTPHDPQVESDSNGVTDNRKAKDDGEEKDARPESALLWTADDEKNVMDLGYSEVERFRRLESMMVRRKSRKSITFDPDSMDDDLSRFRPQLQPISISERQMNPFADDAETPGSAPPILHPQKSLFDFLTEQSTETGVTALHDLEPQESMAVSHQDTLFTRHKSFNCARPPLRHGSRFKPCSGLEEFYSEEAGASSFQRQFSDRSVSRLSVVSECDTASSIGDPEHNDLIRNYIRGVRESPSLPSQDGDLVLAGNE
ncbi:uncharacterized protein LOC120665096 [Panicum virgatum]|uniref:Uncharacterized protein n=1 Tax=Panicum virgatum TaxID=38727 RepID=A0A8T0U859_PANVG|nr:uncharacterized protein LOC120665096 [Panicum virgatum]KAG2618467.1 hypothetical protein PVAP13_3NG079605 [Panicum virgatum]